MPQVIDTYTPSQVAFSHYTHFHFFFFFLPALFALPYLWFDFYFLTRISYYCWACCRLWYDLTPIKLHSTGWQKNNCIFLQGKDKRRLAKDGGNFRLVYISIDVTTCNLVTRDCVFLFDRLLCDIYSVYVYLSTVIVLLTYNLDVSNKLLATPFVTSRHYFGARIINEEYSTRQGECWKKGYM
jgi:hypothetical protein